MRPHRTTASLARFGPIIRNFRCRPKSPEPGVARELGVEYPRCEYIGDDPLGFVISRNLARRHLSETQRARVAADLANLHQGRPSDKGANLPLLSGDAPAPITVAKAAEMMNVSPRSVKNAIAVRDHGVPELDAAVKAGEIAVSAAAEIAKAPAEEQAAIVALPADERAEVLKAKRAEAKAIRASLPTKSEAKRIAQETAGSPLLGVYSSSFYGTASTRFCYLEAMKCHYIPQFYLKRWAVDGHLIEFQRRAPNSPKVAPMRRSSAATGWKKDLYTFDGLPEEKKHLIEKAFFSMVDTKAADALALMESRSDAWTVELRHAWALFLMSLITRHPQDIAAFKYVYSRDFLKASMEDRDAYLRAKGPEDPPTVEEFFQQFHPDFIGNMALNNIPKLVMHERAVASLINMHWSVCTPPPHGCFFTSDRPTIRTFLGRPDSHWLVPIGPRRLFVAAERREYAQAIHGVVSGQGWKEVNRKVVRQAFELGYADNEAPLPFFQKHLAKGTRASEMMSFVTDPKTAPPLDKVP